jgi:iron complex outermembrane receptor protein
VLIPPILNFFEEGTPQHQARLNSRVNVTEDITFDTTLRYVDHLFQGAVPRYIELDARVGWDMADDVEIAIVGQNLLHDDHAEFEDRIFPPPLTEIQRGVYGQVRVFF